MRRIDPADKAHRLIDEAEFELDSIKELMVRSMALDRKGGAKPPPLPLMSLSPPVSVVSPTQPATAGEAHDTLADRLALIETS
jgi:hypothetical protein